MFAGNRKLGRIYKQVPFFRVFGEEKRHLNDAYTFIIYRRIRLKYSDFRKFPYIKGTKKRARVPVCVHRASCALHKAYEADDGA